MCLLFLIRELLDLLCRRCQCEDGGVYSGKCSCIWPPAKQKRRFAKDDIGEKIKQVVGKLVLPCCCVKSASIKAKRRKSVSKNYFIFAASNNRNALLKEYLVLPSFTALFIYNYQQRPEVPHPEKNFFRAASFFCWVVSYCCEMSTNPAPPAQ